MKVDCWFEVYDKPYGLKVYIKGRMGEFHFPINFNKGIVYAISRFHGIKDVTHCFMQYDLESVILRFARTMQDEYIIDYKILYAKIVKLAMSKIPNWKDYCVTDVRNQYHHSEARTYHREFSLRAYIAKQRWPYLFPKSPLYKNYQGYKKMWQYKDFQSIAYKRKHIFRAPRATQPKDLLIAPFKDTKATWEALEPMMDGGTWLRWIRGVAGKQYVRGEYRELVTNYDDILYITRVFANNRSMRDPNVMGKIIGLAWILSPWISAKVFVNRIKYHIYNRQWQDCMSMALTGLEDNNITPAQVKQVLKNRSVERMHNELVVLSRTYNQGELIEFKTDHYKELNGEYDGYRFSVATNSHILKDAGYALNNCVGSYARNVKSDYSRIVIVSKEGIDYLAAIETNSSGDIMQSKIYGNQPTSYKKPLNEAIVKWAQANSLRPCVHDMGTDDPVDDNFGDNDVGDNDVVREEVWI